MAKIIQFTGPPGLAGQPGPQGLQVNENVLLNEAWNNGTSSDLAIMTFFV